MRNYSVLCLLPALLAACSNPIPEVSDPHNIVVDGKPMAAKQFQERYCQGQILHPSCVAVSQARVADATRGPMPEGW